MAKAPPRDEPRRVESPARMAVAEEVPAAREPVMKVVEDPAVPEGVIELHHPDGRVDAIVNLERPHNPMDTVPRDGTMVNLIAADGSEVRVVWRNTTSYNARAQKWERIGFWSSPMNRVRLDVDAVGWTLGEGFATPGMVVA